LVGIERSGPRVYWISSKSFSKFASKIRDPKKGVFGFLQKNFQVPGGLNAARVKKRFCLLLSGYSGGLDR
jgi:hypothetical protein